MITDRRHLLGGAAAWCAASALPVSAWAADATTAPVRSHFNPQPGGWRTFDLMTRVQLTPSEAASQLWLPMPSIESGWQRNRWDRFQTNGQARVLTDRVYGARMLHVQFPPGTRAPEVELVTRVQTRNRSLADARRHPVQHLDPVERRFWTRSTTLLPTDGIVGATARQAIGHARRDLDKVQAIYDWLLTNAYREPKVRGCGEGDIRTMLETGNLGGKCADLNALFVGLCRAVGVPARDVYGLRVAPSAFGYKELGGRSDKLSGAQHCRAEVYLNGLGWVAMDPADVAKVMRQETAEWIRDAGHPLVQPVRQALFGGWEGNWVGWNMAHDLHLPGAQGPRLGFLMYPVGEVGGERLDSYAPDQFRYHLSAVEV